MGSGVGISLRIGKVLGPKWCSSPEFVSLGAWSGDSLKDLEGSGGAGPGVPTLIPSIAAQQFICAQKLGRAGRVWQGPRSSPCWALGVSLLLKVLFSVDFLVFVSLLTKEF